MRQDVCLAPMLPFAHTRHHIAHILTMSRLRPTNLIERCSWTWVCTPRPTPISHVNTEEIFIRWLSANIICAANLVMEELFHQLDISRHMIFGVAVSRLRFPRTRRICELITTRQTYCMKLRREMNWQICHLEMFDTTDYLIHIHVLSFSIGACPNPRVSEPNELCVNCGRMFATVPREQLPKIH
jgi:hypothetical protein